MIGRRLFAVAMMLVMLTGALVALPVPADVSRGTTPDTDSEPNDTYADATDVVTSGLKIPGTLIGTGDNSDYYRITLTNSGATTEVVNILIEFDQSMPAVSAQTMDMNGFLLDEVWDFQTTNLYIAGMATGWYYLNISKQFGDYTYNVTFTVTSGTAGNANHDPTTAIDVDASGYPYSQTFSLDGDNSPADHQDFFKVTLNSDGSAADLVTAYLDPAQGGAKFGVEVYHDKGGGVYDLVTTQVSNPMAGSTDIASYGAPVAGTYFIRVLAVDGNGNYDIRINKVSISKDSNNDFASATQINLVNSHTWDHTDEVGQDIDDNDYFKLTVHEGQFINVTLSSDDYDGITKLPKMSMLFYDNNEDPYDIDPNMTDDQLDPNGYTNGTAVDDNLANYLKVFVAGADRSGGRYTLHLLTDKKPTIDTAQVNALKDPTTQKFIVTENTADTRIKMADIFDDPEGDDVTYSYEKYAGTGTAGFDDDNELSITIGNDADKTVTIEPRSGNPGWTGEGDVAFICTDEYGINNTFVLKVKVKGTNHSPHVKAPYNDTYEMNETVLSYDDVESAHFDLTEVFWDQDLGNKLWYDCNPDDPQYGEKATTTVQGREIVQSVIVNQSLRISFNFESNMYNHNGGVDLRLTDSAKASKKLFTEVLHFKAIDDGDPIMESDATVKLKVSTALGMGIVPEWLPFTIKFNEDEPYTIELDQYVNDPDPADKDALEYKVQAPDLNMSVSKVDRNHFTLKPLLNFHGDVPNVKFTVIDTFGNEAEITKTVVVDPVNDIPEKGSGTTSETSPYKIKEGGSLNLTLDLIDVDNNASMDYNYNWSIDGELQTTAFSSVFEFKPDYDAAGNHTITVHASEKGNPDNFVTASWNVTVENKNRKPQNVKILEPEHNKTFKQGSKITFKAASATDPDGDAITYNWQADGVDLPGAIDQEYTYKKLSKGPHVITLVVSDGKVEVTDSITINIKKKEEGPGFEATGLLLAMLAIFALVALRRRK
jgi:hypothetical protein